VILPENLPPEILNYKGRAHLISRLDVALESVLSGFVKEAIVQNRDTLYEEVIDVVDRMLIPQTLEEFNGNQTKTARLLGISRTTLLKKLKKLKIEVGDA
jgi:DNA-binding protein Fis